MDAPSMKHGIKELSECISLERITLLKENGRSLFIWLVHIQFTPLRAKHYRRLKVDLVCKNVESFILIYVSILKC